jgi:hypothetical protein
MLILVIIINLILSTINFYLLWRIQKIRSQLQAFIRILDILTDNMPLVVSLGEDFLHLGIDKSRQFRFGYAKIQNKIKLLRKILILVNLINKLRAK